ncbi:MAG: response regulator transcription factor [Actinomycetota bacterium]
MTRRATVFAHGEDPISHAGVLAQLRGRPEVEVVETLDVKCPVDVGLLIVDAVDEGSARALRALRHNGCSSIVIVANVLDDDAALRAIEDGAVGIVRRSDASAEQLAKAIRSAASGGGEIPQDVLGGFLRQVHSVHQRVLAPRGLAFAALNDRERDVLRLVSEGHDTRLIASELCYSERTIKNVIQDIVRRFGLRNRCHAVSFAIRQGLI